MRSPLLSALAFCIAAACSGAAPEWKLAVQAWTFRKLTFFETIDTAARLGIKYVEAFPGQRIGGGLPGRTGFNMPEAVRKKVQAKLREAGVKWIAFGVVTPRNETQWRRLFQFAKVMGIETITSEPRPDQLDLVARLCDQFEINVALHNHPKPSRYWSPDAVLQACKGRTRRLGACADTGHWARSGLDPLECLKKLQGRVVSLHFKDLNKKQRRAHDVPWGTGACRAADMLAELKRQGFRGVISIEYEHNTPQLEQNVAKCVAFYGSVVARLSIPR